MTILAPPCKNKKINKPSMELKRCRTLALKIFKTLNVLIQTYMEDLFYLLSSSERRPNNIDVVRTIQTGMERNALDHWDLRSEIFYQNT